MPPSSGVWAEYFHVLYRTGPYYDFIGACQVIAGLLLLVPPLAHIGNLIYFPIILNIAVLTNAVFGSLTPLITILMLLASTWLLCWDFDRLKPLLKASETPGQRFIRSEYWWMPAAGLLSAIIIIVIISAAGLAPQAGIRAALIVITIATTGGLLVAIHHRFMR